MWKSDLLKALNFGKVDSESEEDLDKVFIQTDDFSKFVKPDTFVVIGAKGSGKSALFRLFSRHEASARKMAEDGGNSLTDVLTISSYGFKDIPNMDSPEIFAKMKSLDFNFQSAWSIYFAYKLVYCLHEKYSIISGELSERILKSDEQVKDNRLLGIIRRVYNKLIGDVPEIESISFRDFSIRVSKNKKIVALDVIKEINDYLAKSNKSVWILIDKVDEMFSDEPDFRKKCIEGLFITLIDYIARFSCIKLKIFLRSDIWSELNFVNKSHITDKQVKLDWADNDLCALLVKRACASEKIKRWVLTKARLSKIDDNFEKCFYQIFDEKAYPGQRESKMLSYMINHCQDGLDIACPREMIIFATESCEKERESLHSDVEEFNYLISGLSARDAFPVVSRVKVESYLSEFPRFKRHFDRFEGQQKTSFSREELLDLMKGLDPSDDSMIRQLFDIGIIRPNTKNVLAAKTFEIPRIYRPGLGIITSGRP